MRQIKGDDGIYLHADDVIKAIEEHRDICSENSRKSLVNATYRMAHNHIIELIAFEKKIAAFKAIAVDEVEDS